MKIHDQLTSACGKTIIISRDTKKHLLPHLDVVEFLEQTIAKIVIPDSATYFEETINLGRIIGKSNLIKTKKISPSQLTPFAFRLGRKYPSRIVLNRKGIPCDIVTVEIKFNELKKEFHLSTAYIGYPCPDEPFYIKKRTGSDFRESLEFWCNHAFVYNPKTMDSTSELSWEELLEKPKS